MDENGHSGDNGSSGGSGAESRDRTLLNGWATSGSPWSATTSHEDEADEDIPAWRRASPETRPFTRQPPAEPPPEDLRPFNHQSPSAVRPFGSSSPSSPAAGQPDPPAPHWSDSNRRYEDLRNHFNADRGVEPSAPSRFQNLARPDDESDDDRRPAPGAPRDLSALRTPRGPQRDAGLPPDHRESGLPRESIPRQSALDAPPPSSAPPYPYEGDLDDDTQTTTTFPAIRPVSPSRRPAPSRHAMEPTPFGGVPTLEPPSADTVRASDSSRNRPPSYEPGNFPRRLPYQPHTPPPRFTPASEDPAPPYTPPAPYASPLPEQTARGLPQRVPGKPDVPAVPEPPPAGESAEARELARIATHLRRDDVLPPQEQEEFFDVQEILAAVREVEGVRDAMLRTTPAGANSLRLDLADGADPAEVSRQVARLLQDRMGLDAAMQGSSDDGGSIAAPPAPAPQSLSPSQPIPRGLLPSQSGPADPIAGSVPSAGQDLRRMPSEPLRSDQVRTEMVAQTEAPRPEEQSRPLEIGDEPAPRVMIENVQVATFGTEATVEVRLEADGRTARGVSSGPAVDGYLLRLCATATSEAVNDLLSYADRHPDGPARCFVEHAAAVSFGGTQVAVVVMLMSVGGAWVEQLAGSAMVGADGRHAMVRATLAAVNRRLEALLSR